MSWRNGWVLIRAAICEQLGAEDLTALFEALGELISGPEIPATGLDITVDDVDEDAKASGFLDSLSDDEWIAKIPGLLVKAAGSLGTLDAALVEVTELLIKGCTEVDEDAMETLSVQDVLELRDACLEVNPPAELLGAELGFFVRLQGPLTSDPPGSDPTLTAE